MIRPILACADPYGASEVFVSAGWKLDFSQPVESGDPLVGVSLCGNSVLLGITEGYVSADQLPCIGCGVVIYMTVPIEQIHQIYESHRFLHPSGLTVQPWGDLAFEVHIGGYRFMIAARQGLDAD
ncbi:MAG: hypothetical protein GX228_09825 [Firmicutes bacterium]|jgi:hypothetical protein|nr:hypothetical protein [Bacillota bacterium]NLL89191.1 hypothetical protein [Bacillota bacterium]